MAVRERWGSDLDAYVLFSFEVAGATTLMQVSGTHFQEIELPGLAPDAATLLAAVVPGDWLVQATPLVSPSP